MFFFFLFFFATSILVVGCISFRVLFITFQLFSAFFYFLSLLLLLLLCKKIGNGMCCSISSVSYACVCALSSPETKKYNMRPSLPSSLFFFVFCRKIGNLNFPLFFFKILFLLLVFFPGKLQRLGESSLF